MGGYVIPDERESFDLAKIKANIDYYRGKRALSEEQLAERLGVCKSTYISYVDNPRKLYATLIIRLCAILECSYNDLFGVGVEYQTRKRRVVVEEVVRVDQLL